MLRANYVLILFLLCCGVFFLCIYYTAHVSQTLSTNNHENIGQKSRNSIAAEETNLDDRQNTKNDFNFPKKFIDSLYESSNDTSVSTSYLRLTEKGVNLFNFYKRSKSDLFLNQQSSIEKRLDMLTKCKKIKLDSIIDLSRMIYDDRHKVVMCVVPKAACTTWKSYMWFLQGKVKTKEEHHNLLRKEAEKLKLEPEGPMKTMLSLSKKEAIERLLTYTTFYVTRHPFQRLVSAYSSKFTDRNRKDLVYRTFLGKPTALKQADEYLKGIPYNRTKLGFEVIKNAAFKSLSQRNQTEVLNYVDVMNSGKISFQQFVKFIVAKNLTDYKQDVHWRPQVALCNPCVLNYDYVINFDNLAEESNKLLQFLQKNDKEEDKLFFDTKHSAHIDTNRTLDVFSNLPDELVKGLLHIYADDFHVLGYTSPYS